MQNSFQFMISIIFSRIIKMALLRGLLILKSGGKNISSHGQKIGMPYTFSFFLNSFGWNLICHEKLQSHWISSKLIKKEQTKSLILKATMGTFISYPDFMLCLTAVVHLTSFEKKNNWSLFWQCPSLTVGSFFSLIESEKKSHHIHIIS